MRPGSVSFEIRQHGIVKYEWCHNSTGNVSTSRVNNLIRLSNILRAFLKELP